MISIMFFATVIIGSTILIRQEVRDRRERASYRLEQAWLRTYTRPQIGFPVAPQKGNPVEERHRALAQWVAVKLPLERKLALVRAGVNPEDSRSSACRALTVGDLAVMAGLVDISR